MNWHDCIVCDPDVLAGKPTVKGTRVSVELILGGLAQGWTPEMLGVCCRQAARGLAQVAGPVNGMSFALPGRVPGLASKRWSISAVQQPDCHDL
jgi:hypothetical protein